MLFSSVQLRKFINLYQHHECLWKSDDLAYKKQRERDVALQNIVKEMGMPGFDDTECRKKIRNLRSHYLQELKKVNISKCETMNGGQFYVPKLFWFHQIDGFLNKYIQHRTVSSVEEYSSVQVSEETRSSFENENFQDTSDIESSSQFHKSYNAIHQQPPMKRRKMFDNSEACRRCMEKGETEFDLFGKAIATQLNKMPLDQALHLQLQIQQRVTDFRLAHHTTSTREEFIDNVILSSSLGPVSSSSSVQCLKSEECRFESDI